MKYWHNISRQFRLLWRHVRFSRLVCFGKHNEKKLETLNQLFVTTNDFLQKLEVDYWLIHGTLLGYFRSGKLLKGDIDIDFGAPEQAYRKILAAAAFLPRGFKLYDTSFNHYGPKLYITYKGWEADIYFYKPEKNLLKPYEKDPTAGYELPLLRETVYPLKIVQFWEEQTKIPQDPEMVLTTIYGYIGEDAIRDQVTGFWIQRPK